MREDPIYIQLIQAIEELRRNKHFGYNRINKNNIISKTLNVANVITRLNNNYRQIIIEFRIQFMIYNYIINSAIIDNAISNYSAMSN